MRGKTASVLGMEKLPEKPSKSHVSEGYFTSSWCTYHLIK
jgi:hypothetical protein